MVDGSKPARLTRLGWPLALLIIAGLPILATLGFALAALWNAQAWLAVVVAPAWPQAMGMTLWTGLASTWLAWRISHALLRHAFVHGWLAQLWQSVPAMLATPHAALAVGLLFLLAPSGWLLRAVSPWLTGFDAPPPWPTSQDPWGLGLMLGLVAKEVPFLLWTAATQLQRRDVQQRWQAEHALACTLGYTPRRAFDAVVWPQLRPRLRWPLLAVLAYGLTVVDMALIMGPASPPTASVLTWQWLQDADPTAQAQGAAAAGALALLVACCAVPAGWVLSARRGAAGRLTGHRGRPAAPHGMASVVWPALLAVYAAAWLALAVGSVAGVWPFPRFWPDQWTAQAWVSVWASRSSLFTTLSLAVASSALAMAWSVAWLETAPRSWDRMMRQVLYLPLLLPSVLWALGLYRGVLVLGLEATWLGLCMAHTVMTLPYVLLALSPAYTGFDPRVAATCASLGHGRWSLLWHVKWPLLKRALASAAAVGFAVSVAQYLPTLMVGAGRYTTVTTEAVALAAGGQRSLTSAYAWLLWVLPAVGFAWAAWVGRPRRFPLVPRAHSPS
jgi:putative thiamine transport system permease protein